MRITILTLFPEMFDGPFSDSILKKAQERGLIEIHLVNIRDFGIGSHKSVDDTVYGGGKGMVLRVDVLHAALQSVKDASLSKDEEKSFFLSAHGELFTQKMALELKNLKHLILLCGHYEGVDQRILFYMDGEIRVGDFILTGGEIPSMLITDAVCRLVPGVLSEEATMHESFSLTDSENTLLEYPQFTRPEVFEGEGIPPVLLSGNHQEIAKWRLEKAKEVTKRLRPDLIK